MQKLVRDNHFSFRVLEKLMVEDPVDIWQMVDKLVFPLAWELHYLERSGDLQELSHDAWDLILFKIIYQTVTSDDFSFELGNFSDFEHIYLYLAVDLDLDAESHPAIEVRYGRALAFD